MDAPFLHDKPLLGIAARVLLDLHVLIVGHHKYARARAVAPIEALGVRKPEKECKITPHFGTFTRAYTSWRAPTVKGEM